MFNDTCTLLEQLKTGCRIGMEFNNTIPIDNKLQHLNLFGFVFEYHNLFDIPITSWIASILIISGIYFIKRWINPIIIKEYEFK